MSSKEWKNSERRMAEKLGGERVPITGRYRGYAPDIKHEHLAIEHKFGKRIISSRIIEALKQANATAETNGGLPIVTAEQSDGIRGSRNKELAIMEIETFLELLDKVTW